MNMPCSVSASSTSVVPRLALFGADPSPPARPRGRCCVHRRTKRPSLSLRWSSEPRNKTAASSAADGIHLFYDPTQRDKRLLSTRHYGAAYCGAVERVASGSYSKKTDSLLCFRRHNKTWVYAKRHAPGAFLRHSHRSGAARLPLIPHAIGPEEPHVSSTSSDAVLEKQSFNIWDPEVEKEDLNGFLNSSLPSHPKLFRGQLKNGLRYLILPNKVPANRSTSCDNN